MDGIGQFPNGAQKLGFRITSPEIFNTSIAN